MFVVSQMVIYFMQEDNKKEERKTKMDIRKHRFIPQIQTFSKVITDKKKKLNSRSNLKKRLRDEGF